MTSRRILVVDDEEGILEVVTDTLCAMPNTELVTVGHSPTAAKMLTSETFDLLITDVRMPGIDGIDLLRLARDYDFDLPVLMITAFPSVNTAVESMKLGATDYLTKPFIPDDLFARVQRILEERTLRQESRSMQRHLERVYAFGDIVGRSPQIESVLDTVRRVATKDVDVLITGETGTGKELVAQSIHRLSMRSDRRFMPVDCGAIPESLMESEFFGHERGAFTGAHARHAGVLELASGGTLFLDEVGEFPMAMQAKLLRVLQERRFRRIGGKTEINVDVRVITATNRDLGKEILEQRFRQDLYYRINVVEIALPPLRSRVEDIPLLTQFFVERYSRDIQGRCVTISPEVNEVLMRYLWPGNVRELQNVLKRSIALSRGEELVVDDLPDQVVMQCGAGDRNEPSGFFELRAARLDAFEKEYLCKLLERFHGDVTRSAEDAGMPRGTVYRLLKKHDLHPETFRP